MNYPQRRGKMSNYSKDEAIKELQKKLEIEKTKFDKFVEDLKKGLDYDDEEDRVFLNKIDELSSKQEEDELPVTICPLNDGKDEISLCKSCYSMTKTIKNKCGKCKAEKENLK
jgi:hypothetical protein